MQTNSHAAYYAAFVIALALALGLLGTCIYPPDRKPVSKVTAPIEDKHPVPVGWKGIAPGVIQAKIPEKKKEASHTCVPGVDPYPCGTWIKVNGEWRKM